jgi:hypothetical protein
MLFFAASFHVYCRLGLQCGDVGRALLFGLYCIQMYYLLCLLHFSSAMHDFQVYGWECRSKHNILHVLGTCDSLLRASYEFTLHGVCSHRWFCR